jgi:hypothetical protein
MKGEFLTNCDNYNRLRDNLKKLSKRSNISKVILDSAAQWIDCLYSESNAWPEMQVICSCISDISLIWFDNDINITLLISHTGDTLGCNINGKSIYSIHNPDLQTVREALWARFPFKLIR